MIYTHGAESRVKIGRKRNLFPLAGFHFAILVLSVGVSQSKRAGGANLKFRRC
jgi:hypothetical protein